MAPEVRTFGAYDDGTLAGYYELRQDNQGGVEIAYFGLLPEFLHRGFGGALLTSAIEQASASAGELPGQGIRHLQGNRGLTAR